MRTAISEITEGAFVRHSKSNCEGQVRHGRRPSHQRIDHMALQAGSIEAFDTIRDRLIARGAADEFVTDFGPILSVFFTDPDGLECEVCVVNPVAEPGVLNPPGTPAARYQS